MPWERRGGGWGPGSSTVLTRTEEVPPGRAEGDPRKLPTKPTLFLCAFFLAVVDAEELVSRPAKGQRCPALPEGVCAPINTAPCTRKERFANY